MQIFQKASFFTGILQNFVKILNKFALEHLVVEAFWVLFSDTICMIFFDHCSVYLISSYVMVIVFLQVFKT